MIGAQCQGRLSLGIVGIPVDPLVGDLVFFQNRQRNGPGKLRHTVAVDVHGIERLEGGDLSGNARGVREGDVGQIPVAGGQHIRHRPKAFLHAGDKQRRLPVVQGPRGDPPLLVQLRHGDGDGRRALQLQVPVLPGVIVRHGVAALGAAQHHQLLDLVLVQIGDRIANIVAAHEFRRLPVFEGIHHQRLQVGGHAPAHDQLRVPIAVQIIVADAVNGSAAALDHVGELISLVLGGKNADFQGLFIGVIAEKCHRLLLPVPVQVLQLHRLDVAAGDRCGILRSVGQNGIDAVVQLRVFRGELGQAVQLLGGDGKSAPTGHQRRQQQQPCHQYFPHRTALLSGKAPKMHII